MENRVHGKGTVGKLLSNELGVVHISSGEIFRSYISKQQEIGKEIEKYVSQGLLVPDELAIRLIEKRLQEKDCENGAILDGFPRTKSQAIALDEFFKEQGKKVNIAVELDLSDQDIIDRISKRITCPNKDCRAIYNTEFKPPRVEGICDLCGTKLVRREDDKEETVKQRLETYHQISEKLIQYYKSQDILYTVKWNIHSDKTAEDIAYQVKEYLKKNQKK